VGLTALAAALARLGVRWPGAAVRAPRDGPDGPALFALGRAASKPADVPAHHLAVGGETRLLLDGVALAVTTVRADGRRFTDPLGNRLFSARSLWWDAYAPRSLHVLDAWRRHPERRFAAVLWVAGLDWAFDTRIVGVQWERQPGRVRLQGQSVGRVGRARRAPDAPAEHWTGSPGPIAEGQRP
jgi:hypothetical protein